MKQFTWKSYFVDRSFKAVRAVTILLGWSTREFAMLNIRCQHTLKDSANLAQLSEVALAKDWERPEEGQAWSHLAQLPSL